MKPVLTSETAPKPLAGAPATNESVPFKSGWREISPFATMTGDPSGRTRNTGRFAVERRTQSQSPSSVPSRRGASWIASKIVDRVRLSRTPAPAFRLIFSRRVGRKAGAETFTLYRPGTKPDALKKPFSLVKTLMVSNAEPRTSTAAPICGAPCAFRTNPEIVDDRSPHQAGIARQSAIAIHPSLRSIHPL